MEAVRKHYTRVERERATMEHRIGSILKTVRSRIDGVFNFRDLVENKKDKYDVIVTFSSLLEMAKARVINVEQKHNYGNIEVSAGENVEDNEILRRYSPEEFKEEVPDEQ
jgi:segregation and condensation protein A